MFEYEHTVSNTDMSHLQLVHLLTPPIEQPGLLAVKVKTPIRYYIVLI